MESQKMTRRRFVEMLAATGALSAAFGLYGCGSSQRASEATSTSDDSAAEDSESESSSGIADTITFAQGADPRGLDPAYVDDGESATINVNVYETLLRYAATSCDLEPGLAKEWDVSEDGLTYTFTLEEGVKFHDGTDFNAEAVKKSIERQLEPDRTDDMPYASFVFGSESSGTGVESVETDGDYTVIIKMRDVSAPFLKNVAMAMASPIVSPAALEEYDGNLNENPCGTGPYKFVSWSKGENIKLVANEDYWNKDRMPQTKNLVFRFIAENSSRVTALNNGEVDIISGVDDSMVQTIKDGGNEIFDEDGMTINYMAFNTQSETFKDAAARKAVCKAVNVEELVKALYGEYASVANSVMPLWMAPYDEDIEQTAYDPDAAKKELADLGITKVKMITYSNVRPYNAKGGQTLAETIQGYLQEVGVESEIEISDWTTYKSKVQTDEFDLCFYGWTGDNGDPDNFMNLLADENWSMNVARWDNADYKALIKEGVTETDDEKRNDIYHQCEEMVADQAPWLLISHSKNLIGHSPKIQNYYYHPTGVTFFYNITKTA